MHWDPLELKGDQEECNILGRCYFKSSQKHPRVKIRGLYPHSP